MGLCRQSGNLVPRTGNTLHIKRDSLVSGHSPTCIPIVQMNQILFTHVAFEENMHSNKAFNKSSVPSVPIKAYVIGRSKGRPHMPHYVSYIVLPQSSRPRLACASRQRERATSYHALPSIPNFDISSTATPYHRFSRPPRIASTRTVRPYPLSISGPDYARRAGGLFQSHQRFQYR